MKILKDYDDKEAHEFFNEVYAYSENDVDEVKVARADGFIEGIKFQKAREESHGKGIIETLLELHSIQKNERSSRTDSYMRGMYNGMEVIRASVIDNEIDLIDKDGVLMSEMKKPSSSECSRGNDE